MKLKTIHVDFQLFAALALMMSNVFECLFLKRKQKFSVLSVAANVSILNFSALKCLSCICTVNIMTLKYTDGVINTYVCTNDFYKSKGV